MERKRIGLFPGSFNPIHIAHLIIAQYICQQEQLDEVWFVVSPLNPMKQRHELIEDFHRVEMVKLAILPQPRFCCCEIELTLPTPSYTIDTLRLLSRTYPHCDFSLLIGSDNWSIFDRWKSYREIIDAYPILIYPRPGGEPIDVATLPSGVRLTTSPLIELSATYLRAQRQAERPISYLVPPAVEAYIETHTLYR